MRSGCGYLNQARDGVSVISSIQGVSVLGIKTVLINNQIQNTRPHQTLMGSTFKLIN